MQTRTQFLFLTFVLLMFKIGYLDLEDVATIDIPLESWSATAFNRVMC